MRRTAVKDVINGVELTLEERKVVWMRSEGQLVFESEPGVRVLCGGDAWGYHVWGTKAYSVCAGAGEIPIVLVAEGPSDVLRNVDGWMTLAFGGKATEPWLPISLIVRGTDEPVRKGTLMATPRVV